MDVYFVADNHFGHADIIQYCNRPFQTVDEMNQYMIEQWNRKVKQGDKVFVLGDFGLGSSKDIIKWGKALHGEKILILGNHDHATKSVYLEAGFQEVFKFPILWNNKYLLSHGPKFDIEGIDIGTLCNIHGHVHNKEKYKDVTKQSICVSVERTGYAPISFEEIQQKVLLLEDK